MVLSIGEILVDIFDDGDKQTAFPGGAPFNLACNIAHFDGDAAFYGAVGKDKYGDFLREFAGKSRVDLKLDVLEDRHTTEAIVTLERGERSFRFNRDNGADYVLKPESLKAFDLSKAKIIHIGSLMLSYPEGREFFVKAVRYIRANTKARISFDVNYRDDIFSSEEEAKGIFLSALREADIIKFTEEELRLLSGQEDLDIAIKSLLIPGQVAFVTLGKDGSLFYGNGTKIHAGTKPLKPLDTTGAGDAFYSNVLYELDRGLDLHDEKAIKRALERANFVGGYATQKKGAIGVVPSIKEIDEAF